MSKHEITEAKRRTGGRKPPSNTPRPEPPRGSYTEESKACFPTVEFPLPWKYCPSNRGSRDWIEAANGSVVVFDAGHIDGPAICHRVNLHEELTHAIEGLLSAKDSTDLTYAHAVRFANHALSKAKK